MTQEEKKALRLALEHMRLGGYTKLNDYGNKIFLDVSIAFKTLENLLEEPEPDKKAEFVDWVYTLHLQNTSGREAPDEMFRLGIEAAWEEREKLKEIDNT